LYLWQQAVPNNIQSLLFGLSLSSDIPVTSDEREKKRHDGSDKQGRPTPDGFTRLLYRSVNYSERPERIAANERIDRPR
jgi:hypothetical protein